MVGDPKNLSDLAKIEAALSARCRTCGYQRVFDRVMLEEHLRNHGGVPAWSELGRSLPCRCRSTDIAIKPVPYCREVRDPEQRRYERGLIALAVGMLEEAGAKGGRADTIAVRLALRVLLPHVLHRGTLTSLWQAASTDNPMVRRTGYDVSVRSVRHQLQMMGRL